MAALTAGEDLIAPSVVYGELMPQFGGNTKLLKGFLKEHKIGLELLDTDSVIAASYAWMAYLKRKTRVYPNVAKVEDAADPRRQR